MEKITEYLIQSTVNTSEVRAWEETVMLPTYGIGKEEKNPIFLEKRVYQGSSGSVYPYPVVEKVEDEKHDRPWRAFFIENEYLGSILSDLSAKRGRVLGQEEKGHLVAVQAEVPMAELRTYAIDLKSMTSGTGSFELEFSHYETLQGRLADEVIAEAKAAKAE